MRHTVSGLELNSFIFMHLFIISASIDKMSFTSFTKYHASSIRCTERRKCTSNLIKRSLNIKFICKMNICKLGEGSETLKRNGEM